MAERMVSDVMLLEVIDHGETRYRDSTHLWAFKEFAGAKRQFAV